MAVERKIEFNPHPHRFGGHPVGPIIINYQYWTPSREYFADPSMGRYFNGDYVKKLVFAPIPAPKRHLALSEFTDYGNFGLWFRHLASRFREYLLDSKANEPGLIITSCGEEFYTHTHPIFGNEDMVDIQNIEPPNYHKIETSIHGHPVSIKENLHYPYPSPPDFKVLCYSNYDILIAIDTKGVNILWRNLMYFYQLYFYYFSSDKHKHHSYSNISQNFFETAHDGVRSDIYDDQSIESRRVSAKYLARRLGFTLSRLSFSDTSHDWSTIETIHHPGQIPANKINEIGKFQKYIMAKKAEAGYT
jgi:hypothetical protein